MALRVPRGLRLQNIIPVAVVLGLSGAGLVEQVSTAERQLRRNVAWQVALDRFGFSPGVIDGRIGPKTKWTTREFQRVRGLPRTGDLDKVTTEALKPTPHDVFARYTIDPADAEQVGPAPLSWKARSQLKFLGHKNLRDAVAEKFHCSRGLLARLNPGRDLDQLQVGDRLVVPRVQTRNDWPAARMLEIDLTDQFIRVIGTDREVIAVFHCSVAASRAKLPRRDAKVTVVVRDPHYTFDPAMWPDVDEDIDRKLDIPAGPRNPVGRCWIGLDLPGYGIHGTPEPELIGHTGSHGCFRLANWDALRLAAMVRPGTRVDFVNRPG